jgi:hypothetical protein
MPKKGAEAKAQLGTDGFGLRHMQGEKGMRRSTGDELDLPGAFKSAEGRDEVSPASAEVSFGIEELPLVHAGKECKLRLIPCSEQFLFRKVHAAFDVPLKAFHEQRVAQHFQKGRRKGKRDPEVCAVIKEIFKNPDQGDVGFQHRLMQPGFFEVLLVSRISYVRKVCMEDEENISLCR